METNAKKMKICQNCWWFCHSNSRCYKNAMLDSDAKNKKNEDTCGEWADDLA